MKSKTAAAILACLFLAGCSGSEPLAPGLVEMTPTAGPPEPSVASGEPPLSIDHYSPAGWDGTSDVNCRDMDTQAHAQDFFLGTGGSTSDDPYGLDGDHDGVACETLP